MGKLTVDEAMETHRGTQQRLMAPLADTDRKALVTQLLAVHRRLKRSGREVFAAWWLAALVVGEGTRHDQATGKESGFGRLAIQAMLLESGFTQGQQPLVFYSSRPSSGADMIQAMTDTLIEETLASRPPPPSPHPEAPGRS